MGRAGCLFFKFTNCKHQMHSQDSPENEMWDPAHAQNILMPCDSSTKLIRACYVGNWQDVGDILDEARQELGNNNQARKAVPDVYPIPVHTLPTQTLGSHDIESENIPSEANGLRGLKGAERLAAWKVIEEMNEFDDNRLHPKSLSAGDQVLSPDTSKISISVHFHQWLAIRSQREPLSDCRLIDQ